MAGGTWHAWRRGSSRTHSSGRDKRKSSKAWSWREMYPMKTPTWQLSTFPRWPHHWRLTPTECVPRLGKLLGSKAMMPSGSPNRSATCPTNTATKGQLSLSRLNHWLPRIQAHPEVVQGTTAFHDQIADALLPQTDAVLHHTTAFDTAVDVLNPSSPLVKRLVGSLLLPGQLRAAWLLRRHQDLHFREREGQEAQIL